MMVTVASFKGGVGKTTMAIHLAGWLSTDAPTVLVDSDSANRSALEWAQRGNGLPFQVMNEYQALKSIKDFTHSVIDTKACPEPQDFQALAQGTDLLVVPSSPSALDLQSLMATIVQLKAVQCQNYRVLLNIVPRSSRSGRDAREILAGAGVPIFETDISNLEAFRMAALHGCLVEKVQDARAQRAWAEYGAVYKEVRGILQ